MGADPATEVGSNFGLKTILMVMPAIIAVAILVMAPRESLGMYYNFVLWGALPIILYVIGTGCCIIAQYVTCGKIFINPVLMSSWQILAYVYAALGMSQLAVIRAPVVSLIPYEGLKGINDILTIEKQRPGLQEKATAYWVFWAVLFAQMAAIGKSTVCKS
jgi:hypothetical protein